MLEQAMAIAEKKLEEFKTKQNRFYYSKAPIDTARETIMKMYKRQRMKRNESGPRRYRSVEILQMKSWSEQDSEPMLIRTIMNAPVQAKDTKPKPYVCVPSAEQKQFVDLTNLTGGNCFFDVWASSSEKPCEQQCKYFVRVYILDAL